EDHEFAPEEPELLREGMQILAEQFGMSKAAIAHSMLVKPKLLYGLLGERQPESYSGNVISLFERGGS
ncbi:MAG: helix-turn-helix domain-containing protein, partial [Methylosarcina sp.]